MAAFSASMQTSCNQAFTLPRAAAASVECSASCGSAAPTIKKHHCLKRYRVCSNGPRTSTLCLASTTSASASEISLVGLGEVVDVEDVEGVRVYAGENNKPVIEYLVKWKDEAPPSWEPVENLADNLLRDFEDKWWKCCREGDEETLKKMVTNSLNVLPFCVDSNERSALHFSAALGKAESCALLCELGAEVDLQDKDGYTPLHMAVGYSLVNTVRILLEAKASPEIPDSQGRDVVQLVDSIRDSMPFTPQLAQKRIALEEVSALLTGNLFEEVIPRCILEERNLENGSKEYLVQWYDGEEDSWVKAADIAQDVVEDFEKGYEYGVAKQLLKMKKRGDERLYLVRWADGSENTWEFEDDISPVLKKAYEAGKQGLELEKLLSDPLQWNFDDQLPKKRRRRRQKKKSLIPVAGNKSVQPSASNSAQAGSNGDEHFESTGERKRESHESGSRHKNGNNGSAKMATRDSSGRPSQNGHPSIERNKPHNGKDAVLSQ